MSSFSFRRRAPAWRGGRSSTPTPPTRPNVRSRSPIAVASRARSSLVLAESPAPKGRRAGRPPPKRIDALASAVGLAADWWDLGGKRTLVSPERKIALLNALGLPAASEARRAGQPDKRARRDAPAARPPLASPAARREAVRAPARREESVRGADRTRRRTRRRMAGACRRRCRARARRRTDRHRTAIALPELPIGRHRLVVDGVDCALTDRSVGMLRIAGRAGQAVRRDRADLRFAARRRSGDRRLRGAGADRRGGRGRGRGLSRRQPDAHAVPARPRAGEPLLSRRTDVSSIRS